VSKANLFCDLTKAFDSVNHNVLLSKLEFYGIVTYLHYEDTPSPTSGDVTEEQLFQATIAAVM
jgi:hypothetical protein